MKLKVLCAVMGVLAALLALAVLFGKKREAEITSYASRSLLVLIEGEPTLSKAKAEQVIRLMSAKNMNDLSSAVVLFELLEKVEEKPLTNDAGVQSYINEMVRKYEGRDRPFLDSL